jgi:hypothetical protein
VDDYSDVHDNGGHDRYDLHSLLHHDGDYDGHRHFYVAVEQKGEEGPAILLAL